VLALVIYVMILDYTLVVERAVPLKGREMKRKGNSVENVGMSSEKRKEEIRGRKCKGSNERVKYVGRNGP